ncbi:MAG: hypothetical protein OHK0029_25990 [Armatimonadaceae bacterium]
MSLPLTQTGDLSAPAATADSGQQVSIEHNASPTGEKQDWNWLFAAIPGLTVFFALLAATAMTMLRSWWWEYTKPESYYGYAMFVPALVGLMFWHLRTQLLTVTKKPSPVALLLLIPSFLLLIVASKHYMQAVMSWTFLLSITGAVWFVFGTAFLRVAAFPLLFLWLMAPLPGPVLNDLTIGVQNFSTIGAAKLLQLIGMHPNHVGNLIHLENYTLNVDVPCSGFKQLLTLFTFSSAFAFLTDASLWRRWAIFLFSLPLSIFVNSVRIALIGIVGECLGASAAHTFHDWSGMISLVLCMAILFGTAKVLGCRTFAGQPIF